MPQLLEQDRFTLQLVDGAPVVELRDVTVTGDEGWTFLNRATLLVVDGPGDEGFLLRRMAAPGQDAAPEGWDAAVDAAGVVTVVVPGGRLSASVLD